MNTEVNGQKLILQFKYDKKEIFTDYEQCLDLIKKYPILIKILPKKYLDKKMILTFAKENKKLLDQVHPIKMEERKRQKELKSKNIYLSKKMTIDGHITKNALIQTEIDFGEYLKDEEVLLALDDMEGDGWSMLESDYYELTPDYYNEEVWKKVILKSPRMATRLYRYWCEHIGDDKKLIEHVKVKYQLFNNPQNSELALYKCFDIVQQQYAIAYLYLAFSMFNMTDIDLDHEDISKRIFKKLDNNLKEFLINNYYYLLRFAGKYEINEEQALIVKQNCEIAGDLLPDEYVIKYGLEKSLDDEEMKKRCRDCQLCLIGKCVI